VTDGRHGAAEVGAGFDQAAETYEDLLLHNRMGADRLVAALPDGVLAHIADIGCGTGFASFAMHRSRGTVRVSGIDASAEMIAVMRDAAARVAPDLELDLAVGDAAHLPFADDSVDAAISTMAFHWFPDKEAAVREMARVVRPGGVVAVLAAGRGTDAELLQVMLGMDPPVPPAWTDVFNHIHRDVPEMHAILDAAGLEPVDVWAETRYRWIRPEDYLARLQAVASHLSTGLAADEARAHGERLAQALYAQSDPKGFAYTFVKLFAIARVPGGEPA